MVGSLAELGEPRLLLDEAGVGEAGELEDAVAVTEDLADDFGGVDLAELALADFFQFSGGLCGEDH